MKPIHKFNNGNGATLCHNCNVIISYGLTKDLYCVECKKTMKPETLKSLVGELLNMLESVETSDNETDFHPTTIRSCRIQHIIKLNDIIPKITKLVKDHPNDFTDEEIDKITQETKKNMINETTYKKSNESQDCSFDTYQREMWTVPKDAIYAAQSAISAGLGYANETLNKLEEKEPKNHTDLLLISCVQNDIRQILNAQEMLAGLP